MPALPGRLLRATSHCRVGPSLFDWLGGTSPENASPEDVIRPGFFDALEARLSRLDAVVEHVNAQIAHAATGFCRTRRQLQEWSIADARAALKELAQISQVVGEWLCFSGVGSIPHHPQFDQFAHLDQPIHTGDFQRLQETWDEVENDIRKWHDVDLQTL